MPALHEAARRARGVGKSRAREGAGGTGRSGERLSGSDRGYLGGAQGTLCGGQADRDHGLSPRPADHSSAGRAEGMLLADNRGRRQDLPAGDSERGIDSAGERPETLNVRSQPRHRRSLATLPFLVATGAGSAEIDCCIALLGEAASLVKPGLIDAVHGVGFPPLRELVEKVRDFEIPVYV
jgi:hypothetical protein